MYKYAVTTLLHLYFSFGLLTGKMLKAKTVIECNEAVTTGHDLIKRKM